MRRKRRVEIQIEHREVSIFAIHAPSSVQHAHPAPQDVAAILQGVNPTCPTCGSPELVRLTDAVVQNQCDITALNKGMQDGRIHYHRSPSGEWWLCAKSLSHN